MATIKIDDVDYESDELPEQAKEQLASLQVVEQKIKTTEQELAIFKTARNAYAHALRDLLSEN